MSGGVDSSVSAMLLKAAGLDVTGVWMSNWNADGQPCEKDFDDAKHVADAIGIRCERLDLSKEYWLKVWQPCLDAFDMGHTPNPDVWCNREIKFGVFDKCVREKYNADVVATGHYARLTADKKLLRAFDSGKDQSYFLSMVNSFQHTCFPVGGLLKSRVRELAENTNLGARISDKPDSVGVCFIGKQSKTFGSFLEDYLHNVKGEFHCVDSGHFLGNHTGVLNFTPGQRAKIPGRSEAYFVISKDIKNGTVFVGKGRDHPGLFTTRLTIDQFFFRPGAAFRTDKEFDAQAQTGSREKGVLCRIKLSENSKDIRVIELDEKVRRPAGGQVLALYSRDGVECFGGGVIL